MKTKRFCELIERAFEKEYADGTQFQTVPFIHDDQGPMKECLGVFLLPEQHMAVVAARAMHIIYEEDEAGDTDEQMEDFIQLMTGMLVAPYMQWHCAYFPGLTEEQVLANEDAGHDVVLDMSGTSDGPIEFTPHDIMQIMNAVTSGMAAETRWYSGRGMMGKDCPAFTGSMFACTTAMSELVLYMNTHFSGPARDEAIDKINRHQSDSMGLNYVFYFPEFSKDNS